MTTEISVCMGSSCFARGNDRNLELLEQYIKDNGLSAEIELSGTRCLSKCANGPVITVNGKQYKQVDENTLQEILKSLKK